MRAWRFSAFALAIIGFAGGCDNWLTKPSLYSTVPVRVTQRNGAAVPGAELVLYTGQRHMGYGTTDSSGEFSFTRVPQGLYGVTAVPPVGYALLETLIKGPPTNFVEQLMVQGDTVRPLRFTFLKRGPGTIVVRLLQTTGAPLAGVTITLYDPIAIRGAVKTDSDGRAVFSDVPFGVYGVSLERPFLYRDFRGFGDSAYAFRDDLIVEGDARDSVSIVLTKCAGTIRVNAIDQNGAPVVGATVVAYSATQELAGKQTAADGRATFGDLPCVMQLGVRIAAPAGYSVRDGRGSSYSDGLTFTVGQVRDVAFQLVRLP
jgi:hypothetical protein